MAAVKRSGEIRNKNAELDCRPSLTQVVKCKDVRGFKLPLLFMADGSGEEDDEIVQISEDELKELLSKAGGTIEIIDPATVRKKQAPEEPNAALTGAVGALKPITSLPPAISYPLLILIFGGLSALFLPLFGSGSISSMTGGTVSSESVKVSTSPPSTQTKGSGLNMNACDEECVAKKKMARSCDIFPYSLTPTCTDPDIGNKGILKNLDKYMQPPASVVKERAAAAAGAAQNE